MRTGNESFLTKINFLSDLNWFLVHYSPDIIIVSDSSDRHGDHAALIELLQNINAFHQVPIEQNRCAMACQGCGAVLFLLK